MPSTSQLRAFAPKIMSRYGGFPARKDELRELAANIMAEFPARYVGETVKRVEITRTAPGSRAPFKTEVSMVRVAAPVRGSGELQRKRAGWCTRGYWSAVK